MTDNRQTSVVQIVRKLTSAAIHLPIILTLAVCSQVHAEPWQDIRTIAAVAEHYVLQETAGTTGDAGDVTAEAARIDTRHRLARCDAPLQPFLRRGSSIQARTIVGVRCNGKKPWKIYVPVDMVVKKTVVLTTRALPKNHVLTAADLTTTPRDVSRMRAGYFTDIDNIVGHHLKAPLLGGQVIVPRMLQAALLIRRGQSVTLIVGTGRFSIRVSGVALADGAINQRIRVENSSSGRVVEGVVRSAEHVEVLTSSNDHFFSQMPKDPPMVADTRHSNNDR